MFIIDIKFKVPLDIVDQYVTAHRNYLKECYQQKLLLVSGPKSPRTGGMVVALINDKTAVENLIKQDPYYQNEVADYTLTEFSPVLFCEEIAGLVAKQISP